MNLKTFLLCSLIFIFTSSCSGTYLSYYQTIKLAFKEQVDAKKTLVEVQDSVFDLIYVKRGERPRALMGLVAIEENQYKWISSDNAMLIMENGRITRTLGLDENLLYLSNTDIDPLKTLPLSLNNEAKIPIWSRIADRTGDEYGYPIESTFSQAQQSTVQVLDLDIETLMYIETVNYKAPANYIRLHRSWENQYWYTKSGTLVKSIQKISPMSEALEITFLSQIARLQQ
ncbi:YjbF family lipoprotein [Paraglaciecola arctica]|uniref:YjbF family lipoprotein n=1 Tax=Paraglaciecola arctica TaxID=1128911 RepID=UPI001C07A86B|nr:YjbF family lipoprotein [Paraglaciecola arctica]MBU3004232.1 YjbF family lipoprotein [Paraglaciecola arctica]